MDDAGSRNSRSLPTSWRQWWRNTSWISPRKNGTYQLGYLWSFPLSEELSSYTRIYCLESTQINRKSGRALDLYKSFGGGGRYGCKLFLKTLSTFSSSSFSTSTSSSSNSVQPQLLAMAMEGQGGKVQVIVRFERLLLRVRVHPGRGVKVYRI